MSRQILSAHLLNRSAHPDEAAFNIPNFSRLLLITKTLNNIQEKQTDQQGC